MSRYIYFVLQTACLLAAAGFTLVFLHIATISLFYPFPLEWMEGHTIDIMQRILDGKAFYVKPSLEYVPYIYTPYYFYLSAFVSLFTGVDFLAARLVSLVATLGVAGILYVWVRREGGSLISGLITGGLFLATYNISGRWFDVARVDSLYLLTMLAGLYVFYFGRHRWDVWLAAILFALAFFTKQSALMALGPAFLAALFIRRKEALQCGAATAILIITGCAGFEITSDGWFSTYIYEIPAGHYNDMRQVALFWTRDMLPHCLAMLGLTLVALGMLYRAGAKHMLWYAAIFIGFFGSAYVSRIHSYGHVNVLMTAHLALVLLSGVALARCNRRPVAGTLVCAILAAQFYVLQYDPAKLTPTPEAEERGHRFIEEIAKIDGEVLFSELQFVQTRAGKKSYSIGMAGFDILRADLGDKQHIKTEYQQELQQAIQQKRFAAVVTGYFIKIPQMKGQYTLKRTIGQPQEFVTGAVYFDTARIYVPTR